MIRGVNGRSSGDAKFELRRHMKRHFHIMHPDKEVPGLRVADPWHFWRIRIRIRILVSILTDPDPDPDPTFTKKWMVPEPTWIGNIVRTFWIFLILQKQNFGKKNCRFFFYWRFWKWITLRPRKKRLVNMIVARFFFILLYGGSGSGSGSVATWRIRIRILQKVTDPYGSGSGSATLPGLPIDIMLHYIKSYLVLYTVQVPPVLNYNT